MLLPRDSLAQMIAQMIRRGDCPGPDLMVSYWAGFTIRLTKIRPSFLFTKRAGEGGELAIGIREFSVVFLLGARYCFSLGSMAYDALMKPKWKRAASVRE